MNEILEDVIDGLTSTTAKDRKGEARKLLQHIDTEPLQRYLDRRGVSPGKSIRYASNEGDPTAPWISWPGLIRAVITCSETEVVHSKKGPDATVIKLFRAVTASATRPTRPPTAATRVSGRMFAHIVSRLADFGLSSEVGDAYGRALSSLLSSPHLPPLCSASSFAALVRMFCTEIRVLLATAAADGHVSTQFAGAARSVSTTSEITKLLQRLEALLRAVPATLEHTRAQELLQFFCELFPALAGMHGHHALAHAAVTALSAFFLQQGVSVYAHAHQAFHAAAPFVRLLCAEAQGGVESQLAVQARLACSQACLLALKLDAVRKRRIFQELWGLVCKEVAMLRHPPEPPWASMVHAHAPPGPLSHSQALTMRLAAMHVLRHQRRFGRSPAAAPPPASAAGGNSEAEPGPPVLEACCANMQHAGEQQPTWLAVAAHLAWALPHALEVAELARLVAAACDAVAAALAPRGGAAGEGRRWAAVAWGLLVLEGAARVAWGHPLASRAPESPPGAVLAERLWPQELAAALPCTRMVALAEAAVAAAGGADGPHAHAAACRALWLRVATLQRHLEPGPPENERFWGAVDALMSGSTLRRLQGTFGDIGSQAGSQQRAGVRLHGALHASQKAPCVRDAARCELDLQRAALEAAAQRAHVMHSLHACPPAALQRLITAAVAAPLPALVRIHALVSALGLPVPQPLLHAAVLGTSRVSHDDCAAMAGPLQPYPLWPGCADRGGLQGFAQDAGALEAQHTAQHGGTMNAWGCSNESILAVDALVPDSCTPGQRAAKDAWAMQQHRAEPLSHPPHLAAVLHAHCGAYAALADALAGQLRQHREAPATHAGMLAQLESLAVAAACMLAAARSAAFEAPHDADEALLTLFHSTGKVHAVLCEVLRAALHDTQRAGGGATGVYAALSALLSAPEHLAPAPVVMGSQVFPMCGSSATPVRGPSGLTTQAAATPRVPGGAVSRLQEPKGPLFSSHAAVQDVFPDGSEGAEPFLSMHAAQTLQVLLCALGGLGQLRLMPDDTKRACGDACRACVQVLEGVYEASDKLANEKAPDKPRDDFLAPRAPKVARRSAPAAVALDIPQLSIAHARALAVIAAAARADPFAAFGAVQQAFEWLDDREERGAAQGEAGFVPQVEWVVALGNAAAACGECGAGAAAWRLVTDIVYHDSFGLMKWSPGSLQACHAMLALQAAMARWAALQPRAELLPPPGERAADEVGILQELCDLLPLVLRRCKAVASELCGSSASEARELREAAPPLLRCHWLATLAHAARCVACVPCITAELREVALSCLADPCARVRLCAAVTVPALFAHKDAEPLLPAVALYVHLPGHADTLRRSARASGAPRPEGAPEGLLEATVEAEAPAVCMAAERRECAMAAYVALSQHRGNADAERCRLEALVATMTAAAVVADDNSLDTPEKLRAFFAPIRSLLDWAACREGYACWPAMLRARAAPLLATWAAVGCSVTDLLMIPALLRLPVSPDDPEQHEAPGAVFNGPFGRLNGDAIVHVHSDLEVFDPSSHCMDPGRHSGAVSDMRAVATVVARSIEEISGGKASLYDDIWQSQQVRWPSPPQTLFFGAIFVNYYAGFLGPKRVCKQCVRSSQMNLNSALMSARVVRSNWSGLAADRVLRRASRSMHDCRDVRADPRGLH
eukprot:jgi/Ulvmu1/1226/UM109_0024.1